MIDFLLIIIFFLAIFTGGIIYWMRLQMENLGYNYPFFNSSFKMISDFYSRLIYDKKLKLKYYKTLIITAMILILLSISFWYILK